MSAHQPPSYRALATSQQVFVLEYIRQGCDAFAAKRALHREDDDKTNRSRSQRIMAIPAVKQAILNKLEQRLTKYNAIREAITERLFDLIDDVGDMPEDKRGKISQGRFIREVLDSIAKVSGLQHVDHHHEHQQAPIQINLNGIKKPPMPGNEIPDAVVMPDDKCPQLAISFPPDDPVRYDLSDLDNISQKEQ